MKTICLIPARGQSQRVPRKNIRQFHGKPIIAYSIENAQKSGLFDEIIVSTDDDEIANVAATCGARYVRRPPCDGTQGTQELAGEYLKTRADVGMCCVLYATAPLLDWLDLAQGWQQWHFQRSIYGYSVNRDTRDDIGGYYFGWAEAFRSGVELLKYADGIPIPPGRCCDINTLDDFSRAERMYEALHGN